MTKKLFFGFIAALALFTACSDDDNSTGNGTGSNKYLLSEEINYDDYSATQYSYDSSNRLIKSENYEYDEEGLGKSTSQTLYEYNLNNDPTKIVTKFGANQFTLTTFTYKQDSVFVKNFAANSETNLLTVDTLIIDSKNCLKKLNNTSAANISYNTYEYDAATQLLIREDHRITKYTEGLETRIFTYDNKKGIFSGVNAKPWYSHYGGLKYAHVSNPLILETTQMQKNLLTGEKAESSRKIEYEYTYNEEGYPITVLEKTINTIDNTELYSTFSALEYVKAK